MYIYIPIFTQNHLPPPPESNIKLWVPESTETHTSWKTQENHTSIAFRKVGQNQCAVVLADSSVLPVECFLVILAVIWASLFKSLPLKFAKVIACPDS